MREATNDYLETLLRQFSQVAKKLKEQTLLPEDLMMEINTLMHELPVNDCASPGCDHSRNPEGARTTLPETEWQAIRRLPGHRLYRQAHEWPLASSCGLLASKAEDEWNEEYTGSGDLMYIGAIPKVVKEAIHNFCQEAMKKAVGAR
jgi:hypothetical protein